MLFPGGKNMSNVIYHIFNHRRPDNTEYTNQNTSVHDVKIFTHTGKQGEKFICMKFSKILDVSNKTKNLSQSKKENSFELLQEIMEKIQGNTF